MTPPQPRCWLDYPLLVVVAESKIGSVTRNMKPVAEKTQSTAGQAPATLSSPAIDLLRSGGGAAKQRSATALARSKIVVASNVPKNEETQRLPDGFRRMFEQKAWNVLTLTQLRVK